MKTLLFSTAIFWPSCNYLRLVMKFFLHGNYIYRQLVGADMTWMSHVHDKKGTQQVVNAGILYFYWLCNMIPSGLVIGYWHSRRACCLRLQTADPGYRGSKPLWKVSNYSLTALRQHPTRLVPTSTLFWKQISQLSTFYQTLPHGVSYFNLLQFLHRQNIFNSSFFCKQ
jgi:hypothetical protein